MGIPGSNSGKYIATGQLTGNSDAYTSIAEPAEAGQTGGGTQVEVEDPATGVQINSVVTGDMGPVEIPVLIEP